MKAQIIVFGQIKRAVNRQHWWLIKRERRLGHGGYLKII